MLNGKVYTRCPRAISLENRTSEWVVSLWGECRENKSTPFGEPPAYMTAYAENIWHLLDNIANKYRKEVFDQQQKDLERSMKKAKGHSASSKNRGGA